MDIVDGVRSVSDGGSRIGVNNKLAGRTVPCFSHELGFRPGAGHSCPAGQHDYIGFGGYAFGVGEPLGADRVQFASAVIGVAEHDDQSADGIGHDPRRRRRLKKRSVPITVATSVTAFLPWSFDSPPDRARMLTATS